ncbi:FAD-dependent oxidoreductase [Actinomadura kijaniata]|uniref:NADH dehydrogenase FAD-containing subunit n=1 Tax=Actinomadura namibiensis TaxID=182080 RepID=A0A7W3LUU7_ACTNM|nr:FAD-dependent oxidoreductase [Actinomadura namibiensis]MBA8954751.1 NADH dehydrogenase FAD-containing subunit [Actinomadura namibiensis]
MGRTVVVVGGGYGGASVARALDERADVVLVEPRDAFVQNAVAMRALARPEWADSMFFPYDRLLERGRVVRDRAVSVEPGGVELASGERLAADHVVIATGSAYPSPFKTGAADAATAREEILRIHKDLAAADRVLVVGAGPVGLELAGEAKAFWPDKRITVVDPAERLLPAFRDDLRADLHRHLDELGVDLRLGTTVETPPTEPGRAGTFTVSSGDGPITADIWFRAYGVTVDTAHLGPGLRAARTPGGLLRVTGNLNVAGHATVHAVGDVTDLPEAKMAGNAMQHAEVVAQNILAALDGEGPTAVHRPSPIPFVLLPLGPDRGVGQVPSPDGPVVLPAAAVGEYKGADLFTGRFNDLFGTSLPVPA